MKQFASSGKNVYSFGFAWANNYFVKHLGNNLRTFSSIFEGRHFLCYKLLSSRRPLFLVGSQSALMYRGLLESLDTLRSFVLKYNQEVLKNFISILPINSSLVNAFEVGYRPGSHCLRSFNDFGLFVIALGDHTIRRKLNDFLIYIGHNGSSSLNAGVDMVLPSVTFLEKESIYINMEGYLQKTTSIFHNVGLARSDAVILNSLHMLLFGNAINCCFFNFVGAKGPFMKLSSKYSSSNLYSKDYSFSAVKHSLYNVSLKSSIYNYYLSDIISMSSPVMAKCSSSFKRFTF